MIQLFENFNTRTVFYALSKDEIKLDKLVYKKHPDYNGKAVHTDLKTLQQFIKENFPKDYKDFYYIEVPQNIFKLDKNILPEEGLLFVKTPFVIDLKKYKVKKLF